MANSSHRGSWSWIVNFEVVTFRRLVQIHRTSNRCVQWNLIITRSLGPWKLLLLYQVLSLYQGKKQKYKDMGPAKLPCQFCYIRPLYNEAPLYILFFSQDAHWAQMSKFHPSFKLYKWGYFHLVNYLHVRRHGARGPLPRIFQFFKQKVIYQAKPLHFQASNGENIRAKDLQPPPPPPLPEQN